MKSLLFGTLCGLLAFTFTGCASKESAPTVEQVPVPVTHIRLLLPPGMASATLPEVCLDKTPLGDVIEMVATLGHNIGEPDYAIFATPFAPGVPATLLFVEDAQESPAWKQMRQEPPFTSPVTLQSRVNISIRHLFERINEQLTSAQLDIFTPEGEE